MRGMPFMIAAVAIAIAALIFVPADASDADDEMATVVQDGMAFTVDVTGGYAELEYVDTVSETMTIPDTVSYGGTDYEVTIVGQDVFSESGIVNVVIGLNVMEIGDAFATGADIVSITTKAGYAHSYYCVDGILYDTDGISKTIPTSIVKYPAAKTGTSFEIPKTITSLRPYAFGNCFNLEEITFQDDSVNLYSIPYGAFNNCTALEMIGYHDGSNHLPDTVIVIESSAFNGCSSLLSFTMPESLRNIMDTAFVRCTSMEQVDLNDGIAYIGDVAFAECTSLKQFIYSEDAFLNVRGYVVIDGILYRDDTNSPTLACYPAGRTDESFTLPDEVANISIGAFWGSKHLKTFTVNSRITEISVMAFQNCTALETVNLSSKVTEVEDMAFANCTSLNTVNQWDHLSIIGWGSFTGTGFTTLTIPESVTVLGSSAFGNCQNLTYVTVPDIAITINPGAFQGDYNLKTIDFKGDQMTLEPGALDVGTSDHPCTVTVKLIYGASIPDDSVDHEYTTLDIDQEGKHAYPWENLIGVAVCVLILIGIFRIIREV